MSHPFHYSRRRHEPTSGRFLAALYVSLLVAANPCSLRAQRARSATEILEANIRAELGFLASDALQGRGSGTAFERIAAEYIGSQFRQFGLEPAGDADGPGKRGFVQRVPIESLKFVETPTLSVTSADKMQKWLFGKDFLISFLRVPRISGKLQVIEVDGTPARGAVVVVKLPDAADQQKRQEIVRRARTAEAAAVVLIETNENRTTREAGNARQPQLSGRFQGDTISQFAVIAVSKEVLDALSSTPGGANVELSGRTESIGTTATWNVIGVLRGSDPNATSEVIMLSAHLDHLGVNEAATGDKIFNGADDDASGCVAVMELARALAAGKRPRRTVYFICFGSEERGFFGSRYFVSTSPVPLNHIVANVTFEMLGRPDPKVPLNTLWLTGYDRSTLGPELSRRGALLVADPHPEQNFFQRSDNYTLALRGVVAHTVSSFGLHTDYHRPSDDITKIDFPFMTRSINSLVKPIRWLANSTFRPVWLPGSAPVR